MAQLHIPTATVEELVELIEQIPELQERINLDKVAEGEWEIEDLRLAVSEWQNEGCDWNDWD